MKDILDFILSNGKIEEYLNKPEKYKNNTNTELFGYPPKMLARASVYYQKYCDEMEFTQASAIINDLKLTLVIEELAMVIKRAIFSDLKNVPFLKDKSNIGELIIELYSQFLNKPQSEIKYLLDNSDTFYQEKWKEVVPDEDNVSPEQLNVFYNSIPFPIGCYEWSVFTQNNLSIAYRALPILLAESTGSRKVFDFGGNSGYLAAAMARANDLEECVLIEENQGMLEFARWRDNLCGIKNVTYKKKTEVEMEIDKYTNYFDMGICTEVLEHVYDVEGTVECISRMLRPEGILFISTSFGLYPEASHLKKNFQVYNGKEEELMARHGLVKCKNVDTLLPLLGNMGIYIKVS